jgi:OmpA-OmpF porin, OOP family
MRLAFGAILLFNSLGLLSQNLVTNSGFEEYVRCPIGHLVYGETFLLPGWHSPSIGTPDYFNTCSKHSSHASNNWAGLCDHYSGQGYAGIITFMKGKEYREYLGAELTESLDSGVVYNLQFSFRLSSYSKISTGRIGMALSNKKISAKHDKRLWLEPAVLAMPDSAIVQQTGHWQVMSGDYVAKGGERFIYLGNFSSEVETPVYKIQFGGDHEPMLRTASYYYFDDVVVQKQVLFEPDIPIVYEDGNPFEMDSLIVLKNVQFAYNSAILNEISERELNRLLKFMQANLTARVVILGHTDDQGSVEYNDQLSLRRAEAVIVFLKNAGIESHRMRAHGYGKTQPLIDATDEIARGINRRVEVKLVK